MAKERQKLNLDLKSLFPGEPLNIGEQVVMIEPLGLYALSMISQKIKALFDALKEKGITLENANKPENTIEVATVLLTQFPEILEEASNIDIEDLKMLPIDVIVSIIDKIVEVNMKSKERLEGNFKSLAGKFHLLPMKKKK